MKNNKPKVTVVVVTRDRKDKVLRALESLKKSTYSIQQVVVVDNDSSDGTKKAIEKKFPKVKLINKQTNTGAAAGRNYGAAEAKSELIYFLDDDAYIGEQTIENAVRTMLKDSQISIVQSKVLSSFDKNKILGIAHDINTTTSLITAFGIGEKDEGQYEQEMDIPMVGTGWLVKRDIFEKIGGFDEQFFVPYEDSDLSLRVRNRGYRIVFSPKSKIWHDEFKPTEINSRIRSIGIASPERARFVGRNKIYFMKKHSRGLGRIVFFGLLLPGFLLYHSLVIITSRRFDILKTYLKGVVEGFKLKAPKRKEISRNSSYLRLPDNLIYKKLFRVYEYLSAVLDPVTWILRRDVKTVLDVGCGQGYPMKLLKMVRKDLEITGVDLFDDYIKVARESGVYKKVVKKDVTKLKFDDNSFDAVVCLQVVEHVKKKEGLKMLRDFERIARKQIIITTPVEYFDHPDMDGNKLQRHLSEWSQKDFDKLGYKVKKQGLNVFFGDEKGLVHKEIPKIVKAAIFILDKLLIPFYIFVPGFADYWFVAYKDLS